MNEELVKKLSTAFDLNSYESKILAHLVERKISKANDISRDTRVPRCRVYDTAESLEDKGLIKILFPTKTKNLTVPTRYKALPIHQMIKNLEKKELERVKEKIKLTKKIMGATK